MTGKNRKAESESELGDLEEEEDPEREDEVVRKFK